MRCRVRVTIKVNNMFKTPIIKIVTLIASILTLVILYVAFYEIEEAKNYCITSVEVRYDYITRKLCDPYSAEGCKINPADQKELDSWKLHAINNCK